MIGNAAGLGVARFGVEIPWPGLIMDGVTLPGEIAPAQAKVRPGEMKSGFKKTMSVQIGDFGAAEPGNRPARPRFEATFGKRRDRFFPFGKAATDHGHLLVGLAVGDPRAGQDQDKKECGGTTESLHPERVHGDALL